MSNLCLHWNIQVFLEYSSIIKNLALFLEENHHNLRTSMQINFPIFVVSLIVALNCTFYCSLVLQHLHIFNSLATKPHSRFLSLRVFKHLLSMCLKHIYHNLDSWIDTSDVFAAKSVTVLPWSSIPGTCLILLIITSAPRTTFKNSNFWSILTPNWIQCIWRKSKFLQFWNIPHFNQCPHDTIIHFD